MARTGWVALVLIGGGLLAIRWAPALGSRLKWDGTTYHTVGGTPACLTANRYRKFRNHQAANDHAPMAEMLEQGVCVLLKANIEVLPVRRAEPWLDGGRLLRVRVVGTKQTMVLEELLALEELR